MLGKTPAKITAIRPLEDGVISDYKMTEAMIKYFMKKACPNNMMKPRVALCVPSLITGVEAQAAVDAAVQAGARSVYLIEEPVAAAIGAGIDISRPNGNLILDIGGGTSDIAVLSLNGIVCKTSIKLAGDKFNAAIIKYMRSRYNVLLGERMAERVKIAIASVDRDAEDASYEVKGRHLATGLPTKVLLTRKELYPVMVELVGEIRAAVHSVVERTPPELVGDIFTNGMVMTGRRRDAPRHGCLYVPRAQDAGAPCGKPRRMRRGWHRAFLPVYRPARGRVCGFLHPPPLSGQSYICLLWLEYFRYPN